jgi:cytoskeletal protein CcmA (bactofilin family)
MWKNAASQIEVPEYVPGNAAPNSKSASADHPAPGHVLTATAPGSSLGTAQPCHGSLLGASLRIKGEISGSEDLLVDGSVEGLIQMEGRKLTVGPNARIIADILAGEIVVSGTVKGNLHALERIEIKEQGSVVGELSTSRIMIEDGGYFKGSIEIDRQASAAAAPADPPIGADAARTHAASADTAPQGVPAPVGGTPTLFLPMKQK